MAPYALPADLYHNPSEQPEMYDWNFVEMVEDIERLNHALGVGGLVLAAEAVGIGLDWVVDSATKKEVLLAGGVAWVVAMAVGIGTYVVQEFRAKRRPL